MTRIFVQAFFHLLLVSPIIFINLKNYKLETLKVVAAFAAFYVANQLLVFLPILYPNFRLFDGMWNWTGKLFAIVGSVLFLLAYRKYRRQDYYLTLKQNKSFTRNGVLVVLGISLCHALSLVLFSTPIPHSSETIFFQMTMPGVDEEVAFRGIMLGLLSQVLSKQMTVLNIPLGNPAIWVTSIMFGMVHGLILQEGYQLHFNFGYFISTLLSGVVFAWLTIKSGSILMSLILHNTQNVIIQLIRMR